MTSWASVLLLPTLVRWMGRSTLRLASIPQVSVVATSGSKVVSVGSREPSRSMVESGRLETPLVERHPFKVELVSAPATVGPHR